MRRCAPTANPEIVALNYIEALKTINWAILDGQNVTPFLTLQPPGTSGVATEPAPPAAAGAQPAPTSAPVPTPPAG